MSTRRSHHSRRQASVEHPRHPPVFSSSSTSRPPPMPAPYPQHAFQPSDYESDNPAYLSDIAPPHSPPKSRTNDELNLSVLQRYNPEISSILSIAPYAVIYTFSPHPEPSWVKSGTEGSLFICQLVPGHQFGEDRYTAFILNRRGLENFEAELREADNGGVEMTDDYVIVSFRDGDEQRIFGIWIFSEGPGSSTERMRTLNGDLMKECAVQAGLSRKAAEAAAAEAAVALKTGSEEATERSVDMNAVGAPMGRQISLQELFGRQRAEDAGWSVRVHSPQGAMPNPIPKGTFSGGGGNDSNSRPVQKGAAQGIDLANNLQQQDVLGDLFRKAGLGYHL